MVYVHVPGIALFRADNLVRIARGRSEDITIIETTDWSTTIPGNHVDAISAAFASSDGVTILLARADKVGDDAVCRGLGSQDAPALSEEDSCPFD